MRECFANTPARGPNFLQPSRPLEPLHHNSRTFDASATAPQFGQQFLAQSELQRENQRTFADTSARLQGNKLEGPTRGSDEPHLSLQECFRRHDLRVFGVQQPSVPSTFNLRDHLTGPRTASTPYPASTLPTARRRTFDEFAEGEQISTQENQTRGSIFVMPGSFPADTPVRQPRGIMHDQNPNAGITYRFRAGCTTALNNVFNVVLEGRHKIRRCTQRAGDIARNTYHAATYATTEVARPFKAVGILTYRAAAWGATGFKRRLVEFTAVGRGVVDRFAARRRDNAHAAPNVQPIIPNPIPLEEQLEDFGNVEHHYNPRTVPDNQSMIETSTTFSLQDAEMIDDPERDSPGDSDHSSVSDGSSSSDGSEGISSTDDGESIGDTDSSSDSDTTDRSDDATHSNDHIRTYMDEQPAMPRSIITESAMDLQPAVQQPAITESADHGYDSDTTHGWNNQDEATQQIISESLAQQDMDCTGWLTYQQSDAPYPTTPALVAEPTDNDADAQVSPIDPRIDYMHDYVVPMTRSRKAASANITKQSLVPAAPVEQILNIDESLNSEAAQQAVVNQSTQTFGQSSEDVLPVTLPRRVASPNTPNKSLDTAALPRPIAPPHTPIQSLDTAATVEDNLTRLTVSAPRLTVREQQIEAEREAQKEREEVEAQLRREIAEAEERAEVERAAQAEADQAAEWLRYMGREKVTANIQLIQPLSSDWNDKVDTAMRRPLGTQLATTSGGTSIPRRDFGTVLPQPGAGDRSNGWLNDEIVNAYMLMAVEHAQARTGHRRGQAPRFHAFPSFFYNNLKDRGPESVKRWASRAKIGGTDLLKADTILIPVNRNLHWTLLVISPKQKTIEYFDSLSGRSPTASNMHTNLAKSWLRNELGTEWVDADWTVRVRNDGPQQDNHCDCGVFACTSAKMILTGWDPLEAYNPENIPLQRRRMVAELMAGGLNGEFAPEEGSLVERVVDRRGSGDSGGGRGAQ